MSKAGPLGVIRLTRCCLWPTLELANHESNAVSDSPRAAARVFGGLTKSLILVEDPKMTHNSHASPLRRLSSRSGQAVLTALLVLAFLGFAALAVDSGYLFMSYGQLQTCADSGALAGAQTLIN